MLTRAAVATRQVKSIVFMTYWQGLAVTIIPGIPSDERNKWEVRGRQCRALGAASVPPGGVEQR